MLATGLERLLREPDMLAREGKLGLLYNQASVDSHFRAAPELIDRAFPGRLVTLFGPQHGVASTEQDNMLETGHATHRRLRLPIYSLYSETRRPSGEMLEPVDTILVDIQDVGTRVYTFATTVLYLMQACAEAGKKVVILDRPNPLNGLEVEGNVLKQDYSSFVGPFPIPMRHGLTLGELMTLYNEEYAIKCELTVIPVTKWRRSEYFDETGIPWVLPSPNMPLVETAVVYPGQVVLEGTNVSEGRGTTRPFEIFGSPYLEPDDLLAALEPRCLDGAVLRETDFRPTFNKWAGQVCRGFQIHVTDRKSFRPYRFTLGVLSALLKLYPADFRWTPPPYEYVEDKLPIDVILGDPQVREALENGCSILEMEKEWTKDLDEFLKVRARYLLYT
ncbi:MAG: DUF1343 domain-containing protein [Desulfomonile tiedjei]|nr:DUF1343 domain-containing protein [Desulfomonile tiedjei]